jgi:hypothetical protein
VIDKLSDMINSENEIEAVIGVGLEDDGDGDGDGDGDLVGIVDGRKDALGKLLGFSDPFVCVG